MDGNTDMSGQNDEPNLFRPDMVITPDRVAAAATSPATPEKPAVTPVETVPVTPAEPSTPPAALPREAAAPQPYFDEQPYDTERADPTAITWTASEFIAHQKSTSWYLLLGITAIIVAVIVWFITRDIIATGTVMVGLLLLGVYAGRKPHQETYVLDNYGLTIGNRHYGYDEFRSFSIIPEGAFLSVELSPLKRFAMYTTIYFDPTDQDKILDMLSYNLPMEEARNNLTDSLMRRIHF